MTQNGNFSFEYKEDAEIKKITAGGSTLWRYFELESFEHFVRRANVQVCTSDRILINFCVGGVLMIMQQIYSQQVAGVTNERAY